MVQPLKQPQEFLGEPSSLLTKGGMSSAFTNAEMFGG
jgi:hypothetical protein